jgi:hypothetical protein
MRSDPTCRPSGKGVRFQISRTGVSDIETASSLGGGAAAAAAAGLTATGLAA